MTVEQINFLLALGTLVLQIATVALLALYVLSKRVPEFAQQLDLFRPWLLPFVAATSVAAIGLTLIYSEILGFVPCGLCWLQRVFLYPQALLAFVALYKQDRSVFDYLIALSVPGLCIALYQHYLQMGGAAFVPCPAVATAGADCAVREMFELGYITFPLMSATLFAFVIVVGFIARKK